MNGQHLGAVGGQRGDQLANKDRSEPFEPFEPFDTLETCASIVELWLVLWRRTSLTMFKDTKHGPVMTVADRSSCDSQSDL